MSNAQLKMIRIALFLYCFNLVLLGFIKRVMPHRSCVF